MRTLTAGALAALQRNPLPMAALVEMDLTAPLFLNSSSLDLTYAGSTYLGTGGLGAVGAVQDTPAETRALEFTLSGVPATHIALALTEPVQGKAVRIKLGIFDPDTYELLDVSLAWSGTLDVMSIEDGASTATVSISAEHGGIDLLRPAVSLYSDAEQRRLHSADPSLQFMADQVDVRVIWPAAAWFRR